MVAFESAHRTESRLESAVVTFDAGVILGPRLVDRLEQHAARVPGVAAVHEVQVRWEGHRLHSDLAIGVSPSLGITEAHAVAHAVEHDLLHHIAHLDHVAVHVEPEDHSRDTVHAELSHHR